MIDITMCVNHDCPLAKDCYRHVAVPREAGQSYAIFQYRVRKSGINTDIVCDHFIPLNGWNNIEHIQADRG